MLDHCDAPRAVAAGKARRYRPWCWCLTNLFVAYVGVLLRWRYRRFPKVISDRSIIEAINCSLRQRCGVLVRKSCSFSKTICMYDERIKISFDNHNATLN